MSISVNTVITDTISETERLVLWVSLDGSYGYWFNLSDGTDIPLKFIAVEVNESIVDGVCEADIFPTQLRPEETLSVTEREYRNRRWNYIEEIVKREPEIYERGSRLKILQEVSAEKGTTVRNLYRLLGRYWRSGKNKNGLLPLYSNCGPKVKPKSETSDKNNSKARKNGKGTKILTDTDYANFERTIRKYYLTREKRTLKSTYEKLLQDFYTTKADDGRLKLLALSEVPTFRQFQYWLSKNKDVATTIKKRDGEKTFDLNSRAVLGKSDYGLMGPGAQYQVDATVGDVYLLSQFDTANIIGRPVLYFIIDAFSRMVVGMSVGLEGPSWSALATAITNMAADKVDFCKQYGIIISESEWPCHHLPASLLGDRGELESKNADTLVNMFGIRIVNAPPYRADLKGIVEQHFRTINTNAVALLPGSVKPDFSKRGGHDYRLDSTLNIYQLTQIIIKCVLYYNNHHYMESFEKSEALMAAGVESIPVKLWEWGIANCSGALREAPADTVKFAVLPTANATVTERGIKFKGLFYVCDRAKADMWFEKARTKKYWSVSVSYNPHDMTHIYIWDNDLKRYDACYLLEWNSKNAGKTLAEIVYEQQAERLEGKRIKAVATEAKVNLNADIDSIIAEAKKANESATPQSKRERVSKIRENRTTERAKLRSNDAVAQATEHEGTAVTAVQNPSEEEMSHVLRLIKAKSEENL
jgi:hypothetical protein